MGSGGWMCPSFDETSSLLRLRLGIGLVLIIYRYKF